MRFSNRVNDVRVDRQTEDLFIDAVKALARTTRRFPVNISNLNDIMRSRDRRWHCGRATGATFATLCRYFAQRGVLDVVTKGHSVSVV